MGGQLAGRGETAVVTAIMKQILAGLCTEGIFELGESVRRTQNLTGDRQTQSAIGAVGAATFGASSGKTCSLCHATHNGTWFGWHSVLSSGFIKPTSRPWIGCHCALLDFGRLSLPLAMLVPRTSGQIQRSSVDEQNKSS